MCDGRRQILRVVLAGDAIGGHAGTHAAAMDNIVALTPLTIIEVPDFALMAAPPKCHSNIGKAVALAVSRRELVLLDQILRLGCLTAFERMADLLLDLWRRLTVVGLADGRGFPLPLTQEVLADVLGLSIVHVNRTLQQLRRERLIDFCGESLPLDLGLLPDRRWHGILASWPLIPTRVAPAIPLIPSLSKIFFYALTNVKARSHDPPTYRPVGPEGHLQDDPID
jgi:hypothetical protein